jgi:hypothetical protein
MKFRCSSYSQEHGFRYYFPGGDGVAFYRFFWRTSAADQTDWLSPRILAPSTMICR